MRLIDEIYSRQLTLSISKKALPPGELRDSGERAGKGIILHYPYMADMRKKVSTLPVPTLSSAERVAA